MICPVCKKVTLVMEYNRIELDYCPSCGGVWFDAGELELLLEAGGITDHQPHWQGAGGLKEAANSEKKRRCPVCRSKMNKSYIDKENTVLVDVCDRGDGIWFDGGEVKQLVKGISARAGNETASQEILTFISGMLKYEASAQKKART